MLSLPAGGMAAVFEKSLSCSTAQRAHVRNELKPHLDECWCIQPGKDAEFVATMEDVLGFYQRPFDLTRLLWCMYEKPCQLLGEAREPLPMRPDDPSKVDSEYVCNGAASVFCFMQPHKGTIVESVELARTAVDRTEKMRYLVDVVEPDAEVVPVVMDNLNINRLGLLYIVFPAEEARRLASRLEIHYTQKHGSWLYIAEIGINIMTRASRTRTRSTSRRTAGRAPTTSWTTATPYGSALPTTTRPGTAATLRATTAAPTTIP